MRDFSVNEIRSRCATLFSLKSQKGGEGGRRTGGVGEGLRPPSLFVLVVRWNVVFGGGFDVAQFHHLSHNHSITIARFEAAHFRF